MAIRERGILLPKILTMMSGVTHITQKPGSYATTLHYTDNMTECAIYPDNIEDVENPLNIVSFVQERARKQNAK